MSRMQITQWEYKTFRPPRDETKKEADDPQKQLNDYGEDGWELSDTIDYTGGGTKYLVFKRPAAVDTSTGEDAES